MRLETRFTTIADAAGGQHEQLWVRVFPDTCLIDTFEPTLAEVEVASARAYWREIWRAGGGEADERAAWRGLVASHGSGRAGWIVDTYRPANEGEQPTKARPTDVILVVATEAPLSAADRTAVAAFWRARWRADGDRGREQAALTALEAAVGAARGGRARGGDAAVQPRRRARRRRSRRPTVASSVAFVVLPAVPTKDQHVDAGPEGRPTARTASC